MTEVKSENIDSHVLRLKGFAEAAQESGDFARAETLWLAVLAEAESFGSHDRRLTYVLEQLANSLWRQQKYYLAAPICRRVVYIYKTMLGLDHRDVGVMVGNLAFLYHSWGKFDEAQDCYKESLAIKKRTFGPSHPEVRELEQHLQQLSAMHKRRPANVQGQEAQEPSGSWRLSSIYKQGK